MALEFAKRDGAAYISHLDLQRAFSRAIRRSGLPVKLSEGFNPHYVVSFASALALGVPSECECVEMQIIKEVSPGEFLDAMADALPPGLAALRAVRLKDDAPKLMAALDEAEYTVEIGSADIAGVEAALKDIMASEAVIVSRMVKGVEKKIDIRSMIVSLSLMGSVLVMRLSASQEKSLRPDVMVGELKRRAGDFDCTITRTGLFTFSGGSTQPLLDPFTVNQ
jgi:radical SAM-linked protein